jgi:hypothetical protein
MGEVKGHNKNVISFPGSFGLCLPAVGRAGELHNALSDYIKRRTWHPSQKIKELEPYGQIRGTEEPY